MKRPKTSPNPHARHIAVTRTRYGVFKVWVNGKCVYRQIAKAWRQQFALEFVHSIVPEKT